MFGGGGGGGACSIAIGPQHFHSVPGLLFLQERILYWPPLWIIGTGSYTLIKGMCLNKIGLYSLHTLI